MRKHPGFGLAAIAAGVLLLSCSPAISRDVHDVQSASGRALLWGVPCALIVYGTVSLEKWLTQRRVGWLCWLGGASYSVYLFHPYGQLLAPNIWWLRLLFGIAFGSAVWFVVERRLEELRYSWRKQRRALPVSPPALA